MSGKLEVHTAHKCAPPKPADTSRRYRWTCDLCGAVWQGHPRHVERADGLHDRYTHWTNTQPGDELWTEIELSGEEG